MFRKTLAPFILALLISFQSYASHVTGGFFSYECIGNDEYVVTLTLFRDCSGITMPTTVYVDFTSSCGGSLTSVPLDLDQSLLPPGTTLTPDGGGHISQVCIPQLPNTSCYGGTVPGNEMYVYQSTVTLAPACNSWTMGWSTCCRNTTINVPTSTGDGVYIEATLNSATAPCNSSPDFLTPYPVYYACANQPTTINYSVAEPDNNTLVYSLIAAYESQGVPLTYGGGYSGASPLTGITVDPGTGELSFTPTTLGNFIVALQVEEYDAGGNLIGTNFIDAQVVVQSCPANNTPTASAAIQNFTTTNNALQSGPTSIDMCVNDDFCFDVTFNDVDGDIFSLTSNVDQILPGATVTFDTTVAGTATASVCWAAQPGFTGSTIVIYANDNACPTPGVTTFSVNLNVSLGTFANDGIICGDMEHQFIADGGSVFNWSVVSGDPIVVGSNFSCNPCQSPIATPSQTTTYEVTSNLAGACNNTDQVTVTVTQNMGDIEILDILATPNTVCLGESLQLEVETNQPPVPTNDYDVNSIPFSTVPGSGTSVSLSDDDVTTALPIGFTFNFFGVDYTNFYISSNGFITFNSGSANGCCSGQALPNNSTPNNLIAFAWTDLNPSNGGTIEYFTTGTAPNQILVINIIGVPHFGSTSTVTAQVLIYEGTNIIEVNTTDFQDDGGTVTMGISNNGGTIGFPITGYNGQSGGGSFTNTSYQYNPITFLPDIYDYLWSPSSPLDDDTLSNPVATMSVAGVTEFSVTVFDANMCWIDSVVSVTATNPFGLSSSSMMPSCSGNDDGQATITVIGGVGPFDYLWSSGETTASASGLSSGAQSVTVYDTGAGCSKDTTINIPSVPGAVTISTVVPTDASCNGFSDGTATSSLVSGSNNAPFIYNWGPTTSSSGFVTDLQPGTYTLTVTDNGNCFDTMSFVIGVPPALSITNITTTVSNCNQPNGSATVIGVLGGPSSAYTYNWNNGQTSSMLNNVSSGTYCVTINDIGATNCYTTECVTITTTPFPTATVTSQPTTCNGYNTGSLTVQTTPALGGSSTFTYLWDGFTGFQNTTTASGLGAGVYSVTATDGALCQAVAYGTITEPSIVTVFANSSLNPICSGQQTTLSATAVGGNGAPYSFNWSDGSNGSSTTVNPLSQTFYTVTATDVDGCTAVSIPYQIDVKPPISSMATPATSICENTPISMWVYAWGGTGNYTYTWQTGSTSASTQVIPTSYPIPSTYFVTISDGCSQDKVDSVQVNFFLTPAPLFAASESEGCEPFTTTITPLPSSVQNCTPCLWQLQDGTFISDNNCGPITHTFTDVDYHDITLSVVSNDGCPGSITYTDYIKVNQLPIADFSSTVNPNILDTEIDFQDISFGNPTSWDWTFYYSDGANILGVDTLNDPSFLYPSDTGFYPVHLHVSTDEGCEDDTTKIIYIDGAYMFYIPTSFTPNGDGKNDIFQPIGTGFSEIEGEYSMQIYDRWGKLIFRTEDYNEGWNGKANNGTSDDYVPVGVYIYKISTIESTQRWEDGSFKTTNHPYIGHVTLIR